MVQLRLVEKGKSCTKAFRCDDCDSEYKSRDGLNRHIKAIHEGIRYKCHNCNFLATNRAKLNHHIRSVQKGISYLCNDCGAKFSHSNTLKIHVRIYHKGEEKTTCDQCGHISKTKKHTDFIHVPNMKL